VGVWVCVCGSVWVCRQEHIEPAREHGTHIDGEIQTWWSDTTFSNKQIWKGTSLHIQTGVCRVLRHS